MDTKEFLKAFGAWIVARLSEPSTYAGVAGVITSMTFLPHNADLAQAAPMLGVGVAGAIAIVKAESGVKK